MIADPALETWMGEEVCTFTELGNQSGEFVLVSGVVIIVCNEVMGDVRVCDGGDDFADVCLGEVDKDGSVNF